MSMNIILGCIKKADECYGLINDGDKIAVGVSGGKDSMVLLKALQLYKHFSKKDFSLVGVNLIMGFSDMNFDEVIDYCNKNKIDFVQETTIIYKILQKNPTTSNKLPCSLCSKLKKGAIVKAAQKLNCNKVAFAHHSDDAIETLVLNAIYGGKIATFSPKMYLTNEDMVFIRPLIYVQENDINKTIKKEQIPIVTSTCPNDKHTKREEIKEMLNHLYKKYPFAKSNFLTMLKNDENYDLWEKVKVNNNDKKK